MLQNLQAYEFYFYDIWRIHSFNEVLNLLIGGGKFLGKCIST